jgi:hypothetical protein
MRRPVLIVQSNDFNESAIRTTICAVALKPASDWCWGSETTNAAKQQRQGGGPFGSAAILQYHQHSLLPARPL